MRDAAFFHLSDRLARHLRGEEVLLCNLEGEDSDFVRLNANRIRQAGGVSVWGLSLDLIQGQRQVQAHCHLSGDPEQDLAQALALIERMRERLPHVPEDPYLHYATEPSVSHRVLGAGQEAQAGDGRVDGLGRGGKGSDLGGTRQGGDDPSKAEEGMRDAPIRKGDRRGGDTWDSAEAIADVIRAAAGLDLVGIWASGTLSAGFASSLGHRHWHASRSFNLDFSCYREGDQAVKANLSGLDWEPAALERKLAAVRRDLAILGRPPREIPPGHYRAYLAPAAVAELLDMLAWGGFGLKDHRTAQTPLLRLVRGERQFDPRVHLREEHARGLTPRFTAEGFLKPASVSLIDAGRYQDCLVDSRSAKEYGQTVNAAAESPEALAMDAGDLPLAEAMQSLDTGLAIGNLWYLNYADRNDCRITGMTRFATFWVEQGEPQAPVPVMRFDDSLYHLLGDRLEALTRERELLFSAETYEGRSSASALLPGILVSGIELTL